MVVTQLVVLRTGVQIQSLAIVYYGITFMYFLTVEKNDIKRKGRTGPRSADRFKPGVKPV